MIANIVLCQNLTEFLKLIESKPLSPQIKCQQGNFIVCQWQWFDTRQLGNLTTKHEFVILLFTVFSLSVATHIHLWWYWRLCFLEEIPSHHSDRWVWCDALAPTFLTLWELWIIRALSLGPETSITVWGIKRVVGHRSSIRPMRKLTNSPDPSEIWYSLFSDYDSQDMIVRW